MNLKLRSACLLAAILFARGALGAEVSFEPNTAVWGAVTLRDVVEAPLNPGNLLVAAPRESEDVEVRPDWRLAGNGWKLTARPRAYLTRDVIHTSASSYSQNLALLRWSEAFGTWNASDTLAFDYGLQNFQWGPAESASPSNRLFRDTVQVKDSLYLVRGEHLVRATFAPSGSWSEVLLLEPTGNGEAEPEANTPWSLKAALKSEFNWAGGADFAGLVGGWRDGEGWYAGEYLNVEVQDGLYAYADAEEQKGNLAWYPVSNPASGLTGFAQSRRFDTRLSPFVVSGLRYAFENGNDWRIEEIHHDAGYTTEELGRALAAYGSRVPAQLFALSAQSSAIRYAGLDFPSRDYLYSSIRFPNVLGVRDWNVYGRGLYSLQDHSFEAFASSDNRVGDNGTILSGVSATFGTAGSELKGVVDLGVTVAYRHAW